MICRVCAAKGITSTADVHKGVRVCPCCRSPLCNVHSKRQFREVGRPKRVCGICHTHLPDEQFRKVVA